MNLLFPTIGTRYTLIVPETALLVTQTVAMTPLSGMAGLQSFSVLIHLIDSRAFGFLGKIVRLFWRPMSLLWRWVLDASKSSGGRSKSLPKGCGDVPPVPTLRRILLC